MFALQGTFVDAAPVTRVRAEFVRIMIKMIPRALQFLGLHP